MRSVIVHLIETTEAEVSAFLETRYPTQAGPPWVALSNNEQCLYINFYTHLLEEAGPDELSELERRLGLMPSISVIADISGRHSGDLEVEAFITVMLTKFSGVAGDDYTARFWTLDEIISAGDVQNGQRFFDYRWRSRLH
ncbi:hypothetical protein ABI_11360 [Asticcacaulis biprosthecium C19]|uniref:Uncharacterized protein n=1 Tax=Asticcacaulis biprosthecium C19 TaxID=715226 RepID=F4QHG2_9CAUL|nr:hypothetical protein [Asticcacaulis biprosthecium]EGF92699.1 hypothetical protein ABI_11360 [Asticcacaulis biprosthecium C19]